MLGRTEWHLRSSGLGQITGSSRVLEIGASQVGIREFGYLDASGGSRSLLACVRVSVSGSVRVRDTHLFLHLLWFECGCMCET